MALKYYHARSLNFIECNVRTINKIMFLFDSSCFIVISFVCIAIFYVYKVETFYIVLVYFTMIEKYVNIFNKIQLSENKMT